MAEAVSPLPVFHTPTWIRTTTMLRKSNDIKGNLYEGIHPAWLKAEDRYLRPLIKEHRKWSKRRKQEHRFTGCVVSLVEFLLSKINELLPDIESLKKRHGEFRHSITAAGSHETRGLTIEFAKELGAGRWKLLGDSFAFGRWFGPDAVSDRVEKTIGTNELKVIIFLRRVAYISSRFLMDAAKSHRDSLQVWSSLELNAGLLPAAEYKGDPRIRAEALRGFNGALEAVTSSQRHAAPSNLVLDLVAHAALDRSEDAWVQCEAMRMLKLARPEKLEPVLTDRLANTGEGDDLFVRRRAVQLLADELLARKLSDLVPVICNDPSPYVRQAVPEVMMNANADDIREWLPRLALEDSDSSVRAAALLAFPSMLNRSLLYAESLALLDESLAKDSDPFVLRVGLQVIVESIRMLIDGERRALADSWGPVFVRRAEALHTESEHLSVRRWAAQAREKLWCELNPAARALREQLSSNLDGLDRQSTKGLSKRLFAGFEEDTIGRVLSVMCQDDFGFDMELGWMRHRFTKDHSFGFRMWRLLHAIWPAVRRDRQLKAHSPGSNQLFQRTAREYEHTR